ncbi:MAG: hypothetical protein ACU0DW_04135 [Shimia sp.]
MEMVASVDPDLLVLNVWSAPDHFDQASEIAPTVVVPEGLFFLEQIEWLADTAGMHGVYEARLEAYRAEIEVMKERMGAPAEIMVSRFDISDDGLWFYPGWGAVDQVINDAGFAIPAIQAEAPPTGFNALSVERIQEFDVDVLISSYAPVFGQHIPFLEDQWETVASFWRDLEGVKAGNHFWYERDVMVGYTFESLDRAIAMLTTITAGRSFN